MHRPGVSLHRLPVRIVVYVVVHFAFVVLSHEDVANSTTSWHDKIDLPDDHLAAYFGNSPSDAAACRSDPRCPFKTYLDRRSCWGYEANCSRQWQYSYPTCDGHHDGWVETKAKQEETFYRQADFGYIRDRRQEMFPICRPENPNDSSLTCSQYLRFCRGRRIHFNFTSLQRLPEPIRYRMDVIGERQVGGRCRLDGRRLAEEASHMSPLQSWAPELHHFAVRDDVAYGSDSCDVVVRERTYILKLDATVNMYHHFCDFFNLYASQHMEDDDGNGSFDKDIRILIWDTMTYHSNFGVTWQAFTRHPIQDLKQYAGKTVCFDDVVLPLLPRMIYGMYYNMPLVSGCEGSGLFRAFARHVLHRLRIRRNTSSDDKAIRVTLLSRSTKYRRILNEDRLVESLRSLNTDDFHFDVRKVDFRWSTPFEEQLQVTTDTDILIGMHGAGLTHLLFLPDWAAVFEIYHCEDSGCYRDLARLRGVGYFTWGYPSKLKAEDEGHHPTEGAHAKFTNYWFDEDEFVRIVLRAADYVRRHHGFRSTKDAASRRHGHGNDDEL